MALIDENTNKEMTDEQAQELIRQTIERVGKFILSHEIKPKIGQIQEFAGLPMRVVRYVSRDEAIEDDKKTRDLWGKYPTPGNLPPEGLYFFEVEVAD